RSHLSTALDQMAELSARSIRNSLRNPSGYIPGLVFPLMLAAVYSAQFQRALGLPGFPEVDSFLDFILPASILQSVAFGATAAGADMALDIENGFFDRLLTSPVSRASILVGRLVGSAVEAALKFVVLLAIFLLFGASVKSGLPGVVVLMVVSLLLAIAIGGISLVLALRTGSQEAVNASFPLVFSTLFISSAFFPTELMNGWYQKVAEYNPVSWIINPVRRLVIEGWSWTDAATAIGLTATLGALTITWATFALRSRLRSL
ncbi:MAG: ABC transporter permease, partial [Acidimicrobiia bacterium]|nr:ABC transporter permease [Acidimicrobiia bacterium]